MHLLLGALVVAALVAGAGSRAPKKARAAKKLAKAHRREAQVRRESGQRYTPSRASAEVLSAEECERVVREVEAMGMSASRTNVLDSAGVGGLGKAGSGGGGGQTVRTSEVMALPRSQFGWVYERMKERISEANEGMWGYSTLGEMEDIQIAHYDGTKGGHYTWHP